MYDVPKTGIHKQSTPTVARLMFHRHELREFGLERKRRVTDFRRVISRRFSVAASVINHLFRASVYGRAPEFLLGSCVKKGNNTSASARRKAGPLPPYDLIDRILPRDTLKKRARHVRSVHRALIKARLPRAKYNYYPRRAEDNATIIARSSGIAMPERANRRANRSVTDNHRFLPRAERNINRFISTALMTG